MRIAVGVHFSFGAATATESKKKSSESQHCSSSPHLRARAKCHTQNDMCFLRGSSTFSAQIGRPKKPPPVFHAPQNHVSADRKHQTSRGVKRSAAGRIVQRPSSASSREFPHGNVLRVFPSGFPQRQGMLIFKH